MGRTIVEKKQIDVAAGVQGFATVATDGNQCERCGGLSVANFLQRLLQQVLQHDVEQFCPGCADFHTSSASAMLEFDAVFLCFEKTLVALKQFRIRSDLLGCATDGGFSVGTESF